MKILIQAMSAEAITEKDILNRLTPEERKAVAGKTLDVYVVGEEGKSRPKVLGSGHKVLTWTKAAIRRLAESVKGGTKFFIHHGQGTNSHDGRETAGEILKSFTMEDRGRMAAVAVGVLDDDLEGDYDVCSVEADVDIDEDGYISDVAETSAVALGSSDSASPAFPGAVRMASIQCFGEETGEKEKGSKTVTFAEVLQAVKDMNIHPHQLYGMDDIKKDREFGPALDKADQLEKQNKELSEKLEKSENSQAESRKTAEKSSAKERLEKLIPEGSTDMQKKFIESAFGKASLEDYSDEGLKSFVDGAVKDFSDYAKMFGDKSGEDTDKGGGSGASEKDPVEAAMEEISKMTS